MEDAPIRVKIGDTNIYYTSNLQDVKNLMLLWSNKNYLLSVLSDVATSEILKPEEKILPLVSCYKALLDMVYQLSTKPTKKKDLKAFKKTYYSHYSEHNQQFFKLLQMILEYNTRLFFLLSYLQTLQIPQQREYSKMEQEPYLTEKGWLKLAEERISKLPHLTNIKKSRELWYTNKKKQTETR
jgi:hypothetical protein